MSLASGDLTTIATASAYLGSTTSSVILPGLISRISRMLLNALNRPFILPRVYNDTFSGAGGRQIILPNWPLLSLTNLYIDGALATEASPLVVNGVTAPFTTASGWTFPAWNGVPPGDPAVISMTSWTRFWRGTSNIGFTYQAGYRITDETAVVTEVEGTIDPPVASTYRVTPLQPYGTWATDEGVTYADGTALTAIAAGGTLAEGEYIPPDPSLATPRTYYEFSAADDEADVLLSYGFIPADLEQAVLELVGERSDYRRRYGVRSQMLAGQETIVYDTSGISRFVDEVLSGYKSVLPPALGVYV